MSVSDNRIKMALDSGEDAFWAAVAKEFSEAKTGDLSPDAVYDLRKAMERAVREWVDANIPAVAKT